MSSMNEDFALQLWEQRLPSSSTPSSSASSSASSAASSIAKSKESKGKNRSNGDRNGNSNSNGNSNGDSDRNGDTPIRHLTPVEAAANAALEAAIAASCGQPLIRRAAPPFDRLGVQVSFALNWFWEKNIQFRLMW